MKSKKRLLFWICIAAVAVCAGYASYYFSSKQNNAKVYTDMQQKVSQSIKEEKANPSSSSSEESHPGAVIPVDFSSLQAQNPDIYAWLYIPGTEISYPIVQHPSDNTHYLNYTIDGTYGYPGSIYTENYNTKDFQDFNTVIYGHNMNDGSMFGSLDEYKDESYLQANNQLIIYLPDRQLTYKIFAGVVFDDRHLLLAYPLNAPDSCRSYLDALNSVSDINSHVDTSIPVDEHSRLVTLSTCLNTKANCRFLVTAVLTGEEMANEK